MSEGRVATGAILAAVGLAVLTLTVFFVLRDYGPESTIRRFHEALMRGNDAALQEVTMQRVTSQSVQGVKYFASRRFLAGSLSYRVGRMERRGNEVIAAVVYLKASGRQDAMIWVVERDRGQWKIDADRTFTILVDALRVG